MSLFANKMRFDANTNLPILNMSDPAWAAATLSRTHFDTLMYAQLSTFQVRACARGSRRRCCGKRLLGLRA